MSEPWYDNQITTLLAVESATRMSHLALAASWRAAGAHQAQIAAEHEALAAVVPDAPHAAAHHAIALHLAAMADRLAHIAAQHEALAAALPDAVQASADLATMAAAHHDANVSQVLRGEQQLNQLRDRQVETIEVRLAAIEAKLDQLIAGRCADCPLAPREPPHA
jgi:hypothetical protein